jgi:Coenzyme PQQ synthesis protein D (PqqD)
MFSGKTKPRVDRATALAAKPIHLAEGEQQLRDDGGINLTVPFARSTTAGRFFRLPVGASKTFELDAVGTLVWQLIDGKTSVQQIIRKVGKRYNLSLREAEVSTLAFLQTLTQKGLVGMQLKSPEK